MNESTEPPCPLGFPATTASFWRDDMLPPAEAQRFAAHLPDCPRCRALLAEAAALAQQLVVGRGPDPGDRVWRGVRAHLIDQSVKGTTMRSRAIWGGISAVVVVALLAVLFAHVFATAASHTTTGTSTSSTTASSTTAPTVTTVPTLTPTSAPTVTPTPRATATPVPHSPCNGTSSPPDQYTSAVPLSNAVVMLRSTGSSDGTKISSTNELFAVCYPYATPAQVMAYLNAQMPANGWQSVTAFPGLLPPCSYHNCWQHTTNQPNITRDVLFNNFVGNESLTNFVMNSFYFTANQ